MNPIDRLFNLEGKVAVITGGAGLLGLAHADAIAKSGGVPILWDIDEEGGVSACKSIRERFGIECVYQRVDVSDESSVRKAYSDLVASHRSADILINNAARNPKVEGGGVSGIDRFETFSMEQWRTDLAVGLTGAVNCCRTVGSDMAQGLGGVIVNIASDLAIIAPDQRIYRREGVPEHEQPTKPFSYSVIKHGLLGLTKYLATYWAERGVRVNALSPAGVKTDQDVEFVAKLSNLVPMGRMAEVDEYQGALIFLCCDASRYMTGANLVVDGGRSVW